MAYYRRPRDRTRDRARSGFVESSWLVALWIGVLLWGLSMVAAVGCVRELSRWLKRCAGARATLVAVGTACSCARPSRVGKERVDSPWGTFAIADIGTDY